MKICVYGASSAALDQVYYDMAKETGRLMAQKGHTVVFGGGARGLMGAVAEGAHEVGGEVIGIVPRFFDLPGILYQECSRMIYTETMRERKALMDEMSDAFVALPGGIGTYEELFEILTAKQLGLHDRAVVLLNTKGYFDPLEALLRHTVDCRFAGPACFSHYRSVSTPQGVLEALESYIPTKGSIKQKYDEIGNKR